MLVYAMLCFQVVCVNQKSHQITRHQETARGVLPQAECSAQSKPCKWSRGPEVSGFLGFFFVFGKDFNGLAPMMYINTDGESSTDVFF